VNHNSTAQNIINGEGNVFDNQCTRRSLEVTFRNPGIFHSSEEVSPFVSLEGVTRPLSVNVESTTVRETDDVVIEDELVTVALTNPDSTKTTVLRIVPRVLTRVPLVFTDLDRPF
jgi:hypothetical protein